MPRRSRPPKAEAICIILNSNLVAELYLDIFEQAFAIEFNRIAVFHFAISGEAAWRADTHTEVVFKPSLKRLN